MEGVRDLGKDGTRTTTTRRRSAWRRARSGACLLLVPLVTAFGDSDGDFDWTRDSVQLKSGARFEGVVIEACHADHVVLLQKGGERSEFALDEVARVDKLRDRLASLLAKHRPGLSVEDEWQLALDAEAARLPAMAGLQAYLVLLRDPDHAGAHERLGHRRSGSSWRWMLDGKLVPADRFREKILDWNDRLELESEHFVVETDAGLQHALEVLFDLEGLYLWWMENLGPELLATEDVDDPRSEKITFWVHKNRESFRPLDGDEPYYDPSGVVRTTRGGRNVAVTYYEPDAERPLQLFELGAQSLIYSTLLLGRTRGEAQYQRSAYWAELGLAHWVALHAGGEPGYPRFTRPFDGSFRLDQESARLTLERIQPPHALLRARNELTNLIGLDYEDFRGNSSNIPLCRARCASFVAFLLEADPPVYRGKRELGRGRAGLYHYFREVYGTPKAHSSSAFDDGFGGAKVESLEGAWKRWAQAFASGFAPAPGGR